MGPREGQSRLELHPRENFIFPERLSIWQLDDPTVFEKANGYAAS